MKSFLRRLIGKFKRSKPAPAQAQAQEPPKEKGAKPKKRTDSSFEPLEGRIAPALLLNPTTIQYTDIDGDLITVKFSKALFTKTGAALNLELDEVFRFKDAGHHVRTAADGGLATDVNELAIIDIDGMAISTVNNPAKGTNLTITSTEANGGDGLVNIGYIRAAASNIFGTTLGAVVVDGDLGQIDVGDSGAGLAIASLTVQTMGAVGLNSQIDFSTTVPKSLQSNVTGKLGKLTIIGDFTDAVLKVVGSSTVKGDIGSITIGGSIQVTAGVTTTDIAQITSDSNIGAIKIGTDATDGIYGGTGVNTGLIKSTGKILSLTVTGDIRGGGGKDSGEVNGGTGIGNITLGGNLWAGTGENSGRIVSSGHMGLIKLTNVHGDVAFGSAADAGKNAGTISAGGNIAGLTVLDDVLGGKNEGSGSVTASGTIVKLSIGESLVGGAGLNSARIRAGGFGAIIITETITGGIGNGSGSISAVGNIASITITNVLNAPDAFLAGKGAASGAVNAGGNIGIVKIHGDLDGTRNGELLGQLLPPDGDPQGTPVAQFPGLGSASVQAQGSITSVTLTGDLIGGPIEATGSIGAGVNIGTLKITGNLTGGEGLASGSVVVSGKVTTATVIGKLIGGDGDNSGSLIVGLDTAIPDDLLKATITGGLEGGDGHGSGSLRVGGRLGSLILGDAKATPLVARLTGGIGNGSGSIFADGGAGALTIYGNVNGGAGFNSGAIVASSAVTLVKITGSVAGSTGEGSGSIQVKDLDLFTSVRAGDLATLLINGTVTGNAGIGSGRIQIDGSAKTLTLGALTGGVGNNSGSITIGSGIAALIDDYVKIGGATSITIKGALTAGPGPGTGTAVIDVGARLGALTIEGAATDAAIRVGRDLGKLKVTGALDGTLVTAQGVVKPSAKTDLTIGSIAIGGGVTDSRILAGYDRFGNAINGGAQIGAVSVTGNWTASSLVAGMEDVSNDGFGDDDDIAIAGSLGPVSKIASIIITGNVTGTAAPLDDHFGFTARQIGSMKIAGVLQALTTGVNTIDLAGSPATNDTSIREVA